jgi:hypothetical protein
VHADALKYLEAEGRICPLRIEPGIPVHTGWDLGVSDSTAIWFVQQVGRNYHLVDYYESSGAPLGHYIVARKAAQTSMEVWPVLSAA